MRISTVVPAGLVLAALISAGLCAQEVPSRTLPSSSSSSPAETAVPEEQSIQTRAPEVKAPAAIDPTGPATSVEVSESVFDVMAALNACGYDEGLSVSDPLRRKVRGEIDQALAQQETARTARDGVCEFIRTHSVGDTSQSTAAYLSLALFLSPPPELKPNIPTADLPPDAAPLVDGAPKIRAFAEAVGLHLIWALNREAYDAEVVAVHRPLARMLVETDLYLRQPPPSYGPRRFLVILEPLIAPGERNARVYGGDYIVVESPVNGAIDLKPVKHTYLRFILEPLIYARSQSIDKLTPILELVQPSPLPYQYKSDVLSLVTECMIRAIEARTMATGVPVYKVPAHVDRNQLAAVDNAENAYERKVAAVRADRVEQDMRQGFILTKYFYDKFKLFEGNSDTLQEAVGEMIYGMNVDIEKQRLKDFRFAREAAPAEVVKPAPGTALLDEGEKKLASGDTAGAEAAARQALAAHTGDPGRAEFLLARAEILSGRMEAAVEAFRRAAETSTDPRTVAWSHIYLGRLDDVSGDRAAAVAEYQAAMKARDGRADTRAAAEAGLKAPFAPRGH